jgi:putative acetyltransferase
VSPSFRIRPEAPADRDAVRRVVTAAFERHGEDVADLVDALDAAGHTRVSLVAELGGEVVGHVQLNRSWVDARERLVDVLVLSPLAVGPEAQRSGIGTALLQAAVAAARDSGAPAVFLEGSPSWYAARGFRPGSELGFERPSVRIPDAAFQVVAFASLEPWMTGRLVYCDPFWALDCVGLRDPLLAELEEQLSSGSSRTNVRT